MIVNLIVAIDSKGGIGKDNDIPWDIAEDRKRFKEMTTQGRRPSVVMGRKTWRSLPGSNGLRGRENFVVTSGGITGAYKVSSVKEAISQSREMGCDYCWIIGGSGVYAEALDDGWVRNMYVTRVPGDYNCDTFFDICDDFNKVHSETNDGIVYETWVKRNCGEESYLSYCREIMDKGEVRETRSGCTKSLFGKCLEFDLRDGFPLITTKKVFYRGVVEELLFFIRGDTNANHLSDKNVKIWEGNSSREYLDSLGLTDREPGDLGPVYGFQWRHFGAEYSNCHANYKGMGMDQLAMVVDQIRNNPGSRRIFMSAWNPKSAPEMVLPPCHVSYQFYVSNGNLDVMMYQRSADVFLGLVFNIASTATLLTLIAKITGLVPRFVKLVVGDGHIYESHFTAVNKQLGRVPRPFPTLEIPADLETLDDVERLSYDDFKLVYYDPYPAISAPMAV